MIRRLTMAVLLGAALSSSSWAGNAAAPVPAPMKTDARPALQPELLVFLARDALTLLNHANRSGNYAVLRALGTEAFQREASEEVLAATFADFRTRRIDLGSVLVLEPSFSQEPTVEGGSVIHLAGVFPTKPLAVAFDLRMQRTPLGWRIAGMSVAAQPGSARTSSIRPAQKPRVAVAKPASQSKSPRKPKTSPTEGAVPLATIDY